MLVTRSYNIGGHTIPKITMIVPSIWATAHHEASFKESKEFKPDRFLDQTSVTSEAETKSDIKENVQKGEKKPKESFNSSLVFGIGQHACL